MRRGLFVTMLAALFVGSMCAGILAAPATPNLSLTAARVTTAPVIDGKLTDAAWLTASQMGAKVALDQDNTGTQLVPYPRVAYVAYDAENLYVAYVCITTDVTKVVTNASAITNNDEVEINIAPPGAATYIKIAIDADAKFAVTNSSLTPKLAVAKEGIRWVVELAIPFSGIGTTPKAGDTWTVGLYGHQIAAGATWITWNPTYGSFNNMARFGNLIFGQ